MALVTVSFYWWSASSVTYNPLLSLLILLLVSLPHCVAIWTRLQMHLVVSYFLFSGWTKGLNIPIGQHSPWLVVLTMQGCGKSAALEQSTLCSFIVMCTWIVYCLHCGMRLVSYSNYRPGHASSRACLLLGWWMLS